MHADPILAELWQIKDDLARETGGDLHALCKHVRQWAAAHSHPGPVVRTAADLQRHDQPTVASAD